MSAASMRAAPAGEPHYAKFYANLHKPVSYPIKLAPAGACQQITTFATRLPSTRHEVHPYDANDPSRENHKRPKTATPYQEEPPETSGSDLPWDDPYRLMPLGFTGNDPGSAEPPRITAPSSVKGTCGKSLLPRTTGRRPDGTKCTRTLRMTRAARSRRLTLEATRPGMTRTVCCRLRPGGMTLTEPNRHDGPIRAR